MKTIFAESTAKGKAGVAIIRVSGPDAAKTLLAIGFKKIPEPRRAILKKIKNNQGEIIDEALVLWMPGPNSFTGEDVVEFHLHGSRAVVNMLSAELIALGLKPAEAGEFTRQALLNGRMDLTEVEGLSDLLKAETKHQQKQALRQMGGELSKLYEGWRKRIIECLAFLEAYIDFPDEDLPQSLVDDLTNKVTTLKDEIEKHLNDNFRGEILRRGFHIAILGAPNAGKSTLLNYLARRDVAIVSEIAGTTRDVIEVNLDLGGYPVTVADTAGLRASNDIIETEGIKRAKQRAQSSDLKIIMVDATEYPDFSNEALDLIDDEALIVINKCEEKKIAVNFSISSKRPILISLRNNSGLDILLKEIERILEKRIAPSETPAITRERHRNLLLETLPSLENFLKPDIFRNIELAAQELWNAGNNIGRITGKIDLEDVLDELFRNFCIGK